MQHVGLRTPQGGIGVGALAGDGLEGQGSNELGSSGGQDGFDHCAGLGQLAGQVSGFVGSNAAGDAEHDAFVFQGLERHNWIIQKTRLRGVLHHSTLFSAFVICPACCVKLR